MKRTLACLLIVLMLLLLVPTVSYAVDAGEMEIVTDPETIEGEVGEVVKVNFYLYPNLPENLILNSVQGVLLYDADMLKFGAIVTKDEEQNLRSFIEDGKSTMPAINTTKAGEIRFAWIDVYGWKGQGFWFQIEFRIEQEGASAFVLNSMRYSALDKDTNKSNAFYIEPKQAGAITTGGEEPVPSDAAADMTYEPLAPEIDDTPKQTPTPTPKPQNSGQTVPVTSTLPTLSNAPTATPKTQGQTTIVTPQPAVTSMPITTYAPIEATKAPADVTQPEKSDDPTAVEPQDNETPESGATEVISDPVAEATPVSGQTETVGEATQAPAAPETVNPQPEAQPNKLALTIAVLAGIVVVILLAVLAIVLILVRKKRLDAAQEEEDDFDDDEDDLD